jgi:hypothetical protein
MNAEQLAVPLAPAGRLRDLGFPQDDSYFVHIPVKNEVHIIAREQIVDVHLEHRIIAAAPTEGELMEWLQSKDKEIVLLAVLTALVEDVLREAKEGR